MAIQVGDPLTSMQWARPCWARRSKNRGQCWGRALLPCWLVVEEGHGEGDELEEEVVEFVFVAEVGPELGADGGDRGGVEAAGRFGGDVRGRCRGC